MQSLIANKLLGLKSSNMFNKQISSPKGKEKDSLVRHCQGGSEKDTQDRGGGVV